MSTEILKIENLSKTYQGQDGQNTVIKNINLTINKGEFCCLLGTSGSGKSTCLAAMIDHINRTEQVNVITVEDPIEYLHSDKKSIVFLRKSYKKRHFCK